MSLMLLLVLVLARWLLLYAAALAVGVCGACHRTRWASSAMAVVVAAAIAAYMLSIVITEQSTSSHVEED